MILRERVKHRVVLKEVVLIIIISLGVKLLLEVLLGQGIQMVVPASV